MELSYKLTDDVTVLNDEKQFNNQNIHLKDTFLIDHLPEALENLRSDNDQIVQESIYYFQASITFNLNRDDTFFFIKENNVEATFFDILFDTNHSHDIYIDMLNLIALLFTTLNMKSISISLTDEVVANLAQTCLRLYKSYYLELSVTVLHFIGIMLSFIHDLNDKLFHLGFALEILKMRVAFPHWMAIEEYRLNECIVLDKLIEIVDPLLMETFIPFMIFSVYSNETENHTVMIHTLSLLSKFIHHLTKDQFDYFLPFFVSIINHPHHQPIQNLLDFFYGFKDEAKCEIMFSNVISELLIAKLQDEDTEPIIRAKIYQYLSTLVTFDPSFNTHSIVLLGIQDIEESCSFQERLMILKLFGCTLLSKTNFENAIQNGMITALTYFSDPEEEYAQIIIAILQQAYILDNDIVLNPLYFDFIKEIEDSQQVTILPTNE